MTAISAILDVTTTVRTVADLGPCARAITDATAARDTQTAKEALASLQAFLLNMNSKQRFANEDAILAALASLPHNRGVRVTSWLQAHTPDDWSRKFWAATEAILENGNA